MGKFNYKKTCVMMASVLLSLFLGSCQDDIDPGDSDGMVQEGLPATVTLNISVSDMDLRTRSIVDEASAHYCDNLWIGIYQKEDGGDANCKRIDYRYLTDVADTSESPDTDYQISFQTESANDIYIVAVANSDVNSGITSVDEYGTEEEVTLRSMLDTATDLAKFKNICALRPDPTDVNVYANTLTMSGWYSAEKPKNAADYSIDNIKPISLKAGANNLKGAIYLKRIISYNKFIITAGDNVNLKLNSWRVYNVPAGCSLIEQDGNVADNYSGSASFYNATMQSRQFTATTNSEGKEAHYFEFYQLENKHTATDYAADGTDHVGIDPSVGEAGWYNEREREYKENNLNTGIYRSLVKADKSNLSNNNASYIVVNADIDYYVEYPTDGSTFDATTAKPVPQGPGTIHRTANVNYTIHLGYCEGRDADGNLTVASAQDFNCRRNTRYTYNVTINGVKNVVVEAKSNDGTEPQPGAEGWVSDETGDYETLDSHYCEFNISLTDEERASMGYRITAPYGNSFYYYTRSSDGTVEKTDGMNEALYSWIKFFPTESEDVLAEYNGGKGKNSEGEGTALWTFDDMCDASKVSPYAADSDGKKWYTVFVDEYVYHFDDQGNDETSWPNYVNKDDRIAEFIMSNDVSKDTESSYTYCKYAFAQKSIQSYYKGSNVGDKAIGIEHVEETYCLNMNWKFYANHWANERGYSYGTGTYKEDGTTEITEKFYDYTNGRYNLWKYLDYNKITQWSDVIQPTVPAHVNGYDGSNNYTYGCSHPDADYPVYMPKNAAGVGKPSNSPSPDNNVYYANSICMNRNRDLNGDGVIDDNEIRWFLPTSSQYIQIAISQGELPDPILRFTDYSPNYFLDVWARYFNHGGKDKQYGGRYGTYNFHYITSDYQYYFAEQLAATGDYPFRGYTNGISAAYTARCIRNLGTNPSTKPKLNEVEVSNAFSYDESTRIFNQYNFKDETLRGYNIGGLAPHSAASVSSHPYKKFQVAKNKFSASDEYIKFNSNLGYNVPTSASTGDQGELAGTRNDLLDKTTAWANSLRQNGICGQYTEEDGGADLGTWRIPTLGEMGLMWISDLAKKDGCSYLTATYDYFVSFKTRNLSGDNHLYLGFYNNYGDRQIISLDVLDQGNIQMRCVRDVR